jgi:hypothetical protein
VQPSAEDVHQAIEISATSTAEPTTSSPRPQPAAEALVEFVHAYLT